MVLLWLQAEAVAMATDLAEFVGAALGLHLVFGLPLWLSAAADRRWPPSPSWACRSGASAGSRRRITGLVGGRGAGVRPGGAAEQPVGPARWPAALFVPQLAGSGSALLAVGIVGATVMPHVIYLHSSLTQNRIVGANPDARRKIFRFEMVDIIDRDGRRRA